MEDEQIHHSNYVKWMEEARIGYMSRMGFSYKKVEELGYKTEIIRYKKKLTPTFVLQTIPRLFNVSFIKAKIHSKNKSKQIEKYPDIAKDVSIRNNRFNEFVKKYFTNLSKPYSGWENLVRESAKNYDVFLCGSDQLWLPNNLGSHFYTR